ncbi:hypothetical protein ACFE04_002265 [Oxalis oulophora]
MEWTVEVDQRLKNMPDNSAETERWKKRSIYKVPACVADLNKKAYRPQAVSFGPYHHGEANLLPMEEHKQRALLHFLRRSGKPIEAYIEALAHVVQDIQDAYDPLDAKWKNDINGFLQLMILDGCFMLEILRTAIDSEEQDYAPNDPIFSNHGKLYIMPYIKRDMLMIENQLPILVLRKLVSVETDDSKNEEFVVKLILKFCSPSTRASSHIGKCLHVLDVYHKSLLEVPKKKKRHRRHPVVVDEDAGDIIWPASELNEAGIRFKRSKTTSLKDISFHGGDLRLPVIVVDDATESTFLNLMAFERSHVGAGNEVTSYVFFMDNMIDNERDVALLASKGILQNAIGSDKAVAKLFNSLSKDITLDPEGGLDEVHKRVYNYCSKPWNKWRANLIHTYFTNPWAILSLIAAIFLFALTIAQTVYTIAPYYQSSSSDNSPPPLPIPVSPPPNLPSPTARPNPNATRHRY